MRLVLSFLALLAACGPAKSNIDRSGLEGDWLSTYPSASTVFDVATFRGDSVRLYGALIPGRWSAYTLNADSLLLDEGGAYHLSLQADTLRATLNWGDIAWGEKLVRLPQASDPGAPTPHRISLSAGWCFGDCPQFDLEFDQSGTVRLRRYDEHTPLETQRSEGASETFERLAALAARLRADTTSYLDWNVDAQEVAITLAYGDSVHTHEASVFGLGRLWLLYREAQDATRNLAFKPDAASTRKFASRQILLDR